MFTSKTELVESMGVDPEIAAFFVDRKPPQNNLYWKGRYLYVARGTGYLFIPLFFDLKVKAGVPADVLLQEKYVQTMEELLHIAAAYEFGQKDFSVHIQEIEELVTPRLVNQSLFNELHTYFNQLPLVRTGRIGTDNPALNRGDAFLYLLTTIHIPEAVLAVVLDCWYQLVPTFLLLDDIMDFQEDRNNQEENSLAFYGYNAEGIKQAIGVAKQNFSALKKLNPLLCEFFENTLDKKIQTPYFQHILNN
jgi:hypothetical protein